MIRSGVDKLLKVLKECYNCTLITHFSRQFADYMIRYFGQHFGWKPEDKLCSLTRGEAFNPRDIHLFWTYKRRRNSLLILDEKRYSLA